MGFIKNIMSPFDQIVHINSEIFYSSIFNEAPHRLKICLMETFRLNELAFYHHMRRVCVCVCMRINNNTLPERCVSLVFTKGCPGQRIQPSTCLSQ